MVDLVYFDGWFDCSRKETQPRRLAGGLSMRRHDMGYCRILRSVPGDLRVSKAPINVLISN